MDCDVGVRALRQQAAVGSCGVTGGELVNDTTKNNKREQSRVYSEQER